jgi:hypothetical protein
MFAAQVLNGSGSTGNAKGLEAAKDCEERRVCSINGRRRRHFWRFDGLDGDVLITVVRHEGHL